VGVNAPLEMLLKPSLESLCDYVEASYGLILIFENEHPRKIISCKFDSEIPDIEVTKLTSDDLVHIKHGQLPAPLDHAALLAPLYSDTEQLGALVLGEPENGLQYALEDIEPILEFSDEFSETIQTTRRNNQYMGKIAELIQEHNQHHQKNHPPVSNECIELALRNLYDYPYLADTPLAELSLVQNRLPGGQLTHLERGKAVNAILLEALEKLRPGAAAPSKTPSREWYPYIILQEAYVVETSNRDIMQKLYISEGTFNRTRRTAIRSFARAIGEMEASSP
jgi:hypothetical protein